MNIEADLDLLEKDLDPEIELRSSTPIEPQSLDKNDTIPAGIRKKHRFI